MASRPDDDPTIGVSAAVTGAPIAAAAPPTPAWSSYVPGAIIAGRYRLVALLGRGGMGEVYRADDLTLDHPVALKFLPAATTLDATRQLAQFHNELRVARQVSHKNVCRLYDLGEADGRRFLTMEYIDGEDLASLLRRIGRIPHDKALTIARQLCAGLAAAHERGVLHRDLKPANVMIDGAGDVRITDFGLAVGVGEQKVLRAGTPQYMAPEQLAGEPASIKSDIYALGLILFEVFTGRRVHDAKTLEDLLAAHKSGTITTPSTIVRDIDPAVERIILRCLDREPAERPASALAVAAALPGANPLAEALAAGETPSPELVAAAGEAAAFSPAIGLSILAAVAVGLIVASMLADRANLVARIPFARSLDGLEDRARDIAAKLGYSGQPADSARGIQRLSEYTDYVARTDTSSTRWSALASGTPPTIRFWYRTSPGDLLSAQRQTVSSDTPPVTNPGMVALTLDTLGRLRSFVAVPPREAPATASADADWSPLFELAGLPMADFEAVEVTRTPAVFADRRAAWEGPLHDLGDARVRIDAAAHQGRVVAFNILGPWSTPEGSARPETTSARIARGLVAAAITLIIVVAIVLARRNLLNGRSDRRAAATTARFILAVWVLVWIIGFEHRLDLGRELTYLVTFVPLANAALFWVLYLALEPSVRRYSPETLFSWTRLTNGQFRDPRVGRDLLVGVAAGILLVVFSLAMDLLVPVLTGAPPPTPRSVNTQFLQGTAQAVAQMLRYVPNALQNATMVALVYVVALAVTGRRWSAFLVLLALGILFSVNESGWQTGEFLQSIGFTAVIITLLVRYGVLSLATAWFVFFLVSQAPMTTDFSRVYATAATWVLVTVAALALYGFWASRGREPLLGRLLPQD